MNEKPITIIENDVVIGAFKGYRCNIVKGEKFQLIAG
jgi:hypothetical protein